jgi:small subunit ribosomal protein S18
MSVPTSSSTPSSGAPAGAPRPSFQGARPGFQGARPGGHGPHSGPRPGGPGGPGGFRRGGRPPIRRKVCRFCAEKIREIDYKAVPLLRPFLTARGKLLSGRITGNCAKCQRQLTIAIKRAQTLSLLPYTGE